MSVWKELPILDDLELLPGHQYSALVSLSKDVTLEKLKEMAAKKGIEGNAWQEGDKVPIAIPPDTEDNHRHVYVQGIYKGSEKTTVPRKAPWPLTLFYVRKFWTLEEESPGRTIIVQPDYVEKGTVPWILVGATLLVGLFCITRNTGE